MLVAWHLLVNLFRLLTFPLWALLRRSRRGPPWVELTLHGALEELRAPATGLRGLFSRLRPTTPSVQDVRGLVERIAKDPSVQGLLVNLSTLRVGWSTLEALREALALLGARGKRLVFFLGEGGSQRELYVASASSAVCAPQSASFSLLGPRAQRSYVAPLLGHLGLQVEVLAQGRFKTAAESLVRSDMSDAEREQSEALVTTLKDTLAHGLAERIGPARVEALFTRSLFGSEEARQHGLLDRIAYRDELETALGIAGPQKLRSAQSYLAQSRPFRLRPLRRPQRVAVLTLHGPIGNVASARSIALKPTCAALAALAERADVRGVVLHLDTPGGSASVSDLIHHEVERLAAKKPVVAWMGNVAASGGYYLAAAAQRIVARPSTLTGSIGVISAHLIARDLLERVGVHQAVVKHTPHADLASITRPLNESERLLLEAQSARFYARFLDVVAQGRKLDRERVHALAQGRVWSGVDAHAVGLVDVLGGYESALTALRELLGTDASRVSFAEPLLLRPAFAGGRLWDAQPAHLLTAAHSAFGLETCLPEIVELTHNHGPLLAYALPPLANIP